MNLAGARILITGGAGGIGAALAGEFLAAGAQLMLTDRAEAALARTVAQFGQRPERIVAVTADITAGDSRRELSRRAIEWSVNVVVNNAGVNHFRLYEELTEAQIEQTVAVNVVAPMMLIHDLLPHLKLQPEAHLLNLGSVFGNIGYPAYAAYSASKFAVRGLTEALRRELADTNVHVHYLAPRATRTAINPQAVVDMNNALKVAMDPPETVARAARAMLERNKPRCVIGWPEKLFARINAILPGIVDNAIGRQLSTIRHHARQH
ncbi:MAG: SDR family oxidoreductase [Gammaproteobacteria bacterium]|nr:SDR family oxidoreductase [Gammaproteobacteria bacterium]